MKKVKQRLLIQLEEPLKTALKEASAKEDRSMCSFINCVLKKSLGLAG